MDFVENNGLFTQSVFDVFAQNEDFLYITEHDLKKSAQHLTELVNYWNKAAAMVLQPLSKADKAVKLLGVPIGFKLLNASESEIEQGIIRKTLEIIGFEHKIANNKSLTEKNKSNRPDMVLFSLKKDIYAVNKALASSRTFNGRKFCQPAVFILEAKKPTEKTENENHIAQLQGYLDNYAKDWGILSNGLSWRLSHKSNQENYFRFDLVLFLQQFIGKNKCKPNDEDIKTFALFEHLYGAKAHSSGFLKNLFSETQQANENLREVLKQNAHNAVEHIANGFWLDGKNRDKGFIAEEPQQKDLDYLREQSLILLYRLLFILKAESRQLLLKEVDGELSAYAQEYALSTLLENLEAKTPAQLERSTVYRVLQAFFKDIDGGDLSYGVPAYNGGLFDPETHTDLIKWRMTDAALKKVLTALMYADEAQKEEIVWKELEVRDLGDVYEGLLEQRLILEDSGELSELVLKNEKGERKASGSYFTPDSMVTQLVNATLLPSLKACKANPNKILDLKVLDPAMGSGHFLVKVVDVMSRYLAMYCNPQDLTHPDKGIKDTKDAAERAYWKRKIIDNCIYGVDYNPMSVELAKVALWLHTAEYAKPLSFLSHHLKVGNTLLGADIDELQEPALELKALKSGMIWKVKPRTKETLENKPQKVPVEQQLDLFFIDENIISGVLENVRNLLAASSANRDDIHNKRKKYQQIVRELSAHKLLADLWCVQWFFVKPDSRGEKAFGVHGNSLYNQLLKICNIKDSESRQVELEKFKNNSFIKRVRKNTEHGYGARPTMFFHWQLEFPEVAFDKRGQPKTDYGFDVVLGNPPWNKIKPDTKAFYAPYSEEVANTQGTSIKKLVHELELKHPHLPQEWLDYENTIKKTVFFLKESQHYQHQSALVEGKKTGGDPDLFRFFIERAYQCARVGGRVGLVTPAGLWQAEGCTALRRLLFQHNQLEQLYTFENFRKWAFGIHTSFKFSSFVFKKLAEDKKPKAEHTFKAAFMLRHDRILNETPPSLRLMDLSFEAVQAFSPETLALLDFKAAGDSALVSKLHQNFSALGKSDWKIKYRCELHMTNDAYLFKKPEWMAIRGFTGLVSNKADFYENRGYEKLEIELKNKENLSVYLHPDDKKSAEENPHLNEAHFYIVPDETYVPLYEGRMVHIFDHCQKEYLEGEGRTAKWGNLDFDNKALKPRVYVSLKESQIDLHDKLGFCDVTGATNERTTLSSLLPKNIACGHKVPTFTVKDNSSKNLILLQCLMSSFVWDFLIRLRVSTSMTMNFLTQVPVPNLADIDEFLSTELCQRAVKLSCTTAEMASYWNHVYPDNTWTEDSAEKDLNKRALLRAEIDARIAKLYGLSLEDYARILTHFPLLDRNYEPLTGDKFVAEGTTEEKTDRAFITRDLALHAYLCYLNKQGEKIPFIDDLEKFYSEHVQLNPISEESRFRIGEIKDLEIRVKTALKNGAIAYSPS
ncbi:MAG: N-6 DNA methylase [Methylococcales bacterium]|nr:N-6 DNA methylase [Methylococcales bacterium]